MRKLTTLVVYVLYYILYITGNKTRNIDMSKISETLKYHYFEVVTSKILDFGGLLYEEVTKFNVVVCGRVFFTYPESFTQFQYKMIEKQHF